MTTSHITFRRRVRRSALALAVSAICLPAGSALAQGDTKADYPGTGEPPATKVGDTPADYPGSDGNIGTHFPVAPKAGDTPADYPGMPGSPVVVAEPVAHDTSAASGFDWTSAAVGAGAAGLLVVVSLGGASAASRIRMRTVRS